MSISNADKDFIELVKKLWAFETGDLSFKPNEKKKLEAELHKAWLEQDRVELREYHDPNLAKAMGFLIQVTKDDPFKINEDCTDWHNWWGDEGLDNWPFHIKRYFELVPPYVRVGSIIPQNIKTLYSESRWCFIYENFNACIVLSRGIIDAVSKQTNPLDKAKENNVYTKKVVNLMKNEGIISPKLETNILEKIVYKANKILHQGETTSKEECLESIECVKTFLEDVYSKNSYKKN